MTSAIFYTFYCILKFRIYQSEKTDQIIIFLLKIICALSEAQLETIFKPEYLYIILNAFKNLWHHSFVSTFDKECKMYSASLGRLGS